MKNLMLVGAALVLIGCDSSQKSPEEIQREIEASQRKFAEERQRIERENAAREKKIAEQRSLVGARFISVDADYIDIELTNQTDKDIDNIVGSLDILDQAGNYVTGIALTNWVPDDVYLPAGGSKPARKSLELEHPEKKAKMLREAEMYSYFYTVHRIQYVGENAFNFMEPAVSADKRTADESPAVRKPKTVVVNQAEPEPCAANQITLETTEQYYPGPKCSHVERNIESERFKQEFIQLCQTETKSAIAPPSAARVQLSSCMPASNGVGLVYSKQICCDLP